MFLKNLGFGFGGVVGGCGGGMMTTLLHRHPEQYFHESRFTRSLQYFRDVGPSYIVTKPTSGLCSTLGFRRAFGENSKLSRGKLFRVMIMTLFVSRTPRTIFPHLACTHHTVLQKQTLLRRGLGFRGVGELRPCNYSWHLCFWCLYDFALLVLGVLKPSWQHLRFARYYRAFVPPVL